MDIGAVMTEVSQRIDLINGLRCFDYPPAALVPPAAVVSYPLSMTFNVAGGIDRMRLPVVLVIGKPSDRSTKGRLVRYCNKEGASSIKARIENNTPPYASFGDVSVMGIEFGETTINEIDYVSALFTLDIAG